MAKLPKFSDLSASMPGVFGKFKSMLDSLSGPASAEETEKALGEETDPYKRNILEVELLIKQLNDIQMIQNKTLDRLKNRYLELQQKLMSEIAATQAAITTSTTTTHTGMPGVESTTTPSATTTEKTQKIETEEPTSVPTPGVTEITKDQKTEATDLEPPKQNT